jgi:hypothetical protein
MSLIGAARYKLLLLIFKDLGSFEKIKIFC